MPLLRALSPIQLADRLVAIGEDLDLDVAEADLMVRLGAAELIDIAAPAAISPAAGDGEGEASGGASPIADPDAEPDEDAKPKARRR